MPNQPVIPFGNLPQQPLGPLTGWESGFNSAIGIDQQEANRRDQEIQAQLEQNKLLNETLNNPVLAAKRALEMSTIGEQQKAYDSGEIPGMLSAGRQAATAKSLADKSVSELTQASVRAQNVVSFAKSLKDASPADLSIPGGKWDVIKETGKKLGLPSEWFPDKYTPEAGAQIQQAAAFAINSQPFLQQQLLLKQKGEQEIGQVKEQGAQARQTFQESVPGRVEIAKAGFQNQLGLRLASMTPGQQATFQIQQKINNGIPLDEGDLQQAEAAVQERLKQSAPNLEADLEKNLVTTFRANRDLRLQWAKSHGMPDDAPPEMMAHVEAQNQYRKVVQKQTLQQYANAKFNIRGQDMEVKDGTLVPIGKGEGSKASDTTSAPSTTAAIASIPAIPGTAGEPMSPELGGATPPAQTTPSSPSIPKVGTIMGGYKFKGGDPSDKKNWEKVK